MEGSTDEIQLWVLLCFVVVVVLKVHVMPLTEKNVNMFTNTGWDTV